MKRLLLAVAAWGGLLAAVHPALAQTWTLTSAPITNWTCVASSADGSKLFAAGASRLYTSADGGTTWTFLTNAPSAGRVVCSADGSKLVVLGGGVVSTSTNSGGTWWATSPPGGPYESVASSADGMSLVALAPGGYPMPFPPPSVCLSTNSGVTWRLADAPPIVWNSVASSADGRTLIAAGAAWRAGGGVFVSTNSGLTWTDTGFFGGGRVASSADGTELVAVTGGGLYVSTNSGLNWTPINPPYYGAPAVASSADGSRLVVMASGGTVYSSADTGLNWTSNSAPTTNWSSVASSADGCKLVAAVQGGGIYTWQTTPHPVLHVTPSGTNLLLSWIIPSQPFVLQENADLATTNWTDVASAPVLNLTNLQHQVTVPLANARRFYRLRAVTD